MQSIETNRANRDLRVLIVRVGAMGDVLHGLPAVAALRRMMPGCFIGWAVEPRWMPLLVADGTGRDAMPVVNAVHRVPTREWKKRPLARQTTREIWALRGELQAGRYDLCVDLQGAIRSAVIGRLSGAHRLYGPAIPRERQARWIYDEHVRTRQVHVVEQACEILGAACGVGLSPVASALPFGRTAEDWADGVLASLGLEEGAPFAMIAPTAGWGAKEWPVERYHAVAVRLRAAGYRVLVNAAGRHDAMAQAVAHDHAATVIPCTLEELVALMRRAAVVIGGDTGPVHLAAALGRRVVALFGPTDPARTGPYGGESRVLRHAASVVDHRRHTTTEAGLAEITVDEVAEAALQLLEEAERG